MDLPHLSIMQGSDALNKQGNCVAKIYDEFKNRLIEATNTMSLVLRKLMTWAGDKQAANGLMTKTSNALGWGRLWLAGLNAMIRKTKMGFS